MSSIKTVYKTGTGTMGRGHWDACVGTWNLETRGRDAETWGRGDVGTLGRGDAGTRGRGDAGTSNIGDAGGKVGGKCDISFFVKMCYLWSTLDPHRTPYDVYTKYFFI